MGRFIDKLGIEGVVDRTVSIVRGAMHTMDWE